MWAKSVSDLVIVFLSKEGMVVQALTIIYKSQLSLTNLIIVINMNDIIIVVKIDHIIISDLCVVKQLDLSETSLFLLFVLFSAVTASSDVEVTIVNQQEHFSR